MAFIKSILLLGSLISGIALIITGIALVVVNKPYSAFDRTLVDKVNAALPQWEKSLDDFKLSSVYLVDNMTEINFTVNTSPDPELSNIINYNPYNFVLRTNWSYIDEPFVIYTLTPNFDIELFYKLSDSVKTISANIFQQTNISASLQDCNNMQGNWSSGTCNLYWVITSVCIKVTLNNITNEWVLPSGMHTGGCIPFPNGTTGNWPFGIYRQVPASPTGVPTNNFTITDIPIVVRNMNDPYVVAADLTGSTFQLITSYNVADNKRIIGFGLVGLGLLLAILAGIIYIITNAKKKSEKKGESLLKTENLDD